jgi:O-glycosyl hydrolase
VQNEPAASQRWDSCLYTAGEERGFVRDHLGPALAAAGLGHVHIVIHDHNRDEMVERAGVIHSDPEAARFVRPSARRVLCAATKETPECTAFANDDDALAVVVLNRGEAALPFVLATAGEHRRVELPPHAITTLLS